MDPFFFTCFINGNLIETVHRNGLKAQDKILYWDTRNQSKLFLKIGFLREKSKSLFVRNF